MRTQLALSLPASRPPVLRVHLGDDEILVDNFAGGGGASTGLESAVGRSPDIAVNHCPKAIAVHAANHPTTTHYLTSVYKVDPIKACAGKRVALAWFSPDCTHHSKAKGGKPRQQKIRGLAWVAIRWAAKVRPRVIVIENVEEWLQWGPLHREHTNGCRGERRERRIRGRSRETTTCRKGCRFGQPIKERAGETFRAFVRKLKRLGFDVAWRVLRASDYGAPTSRRRVFLKARSDGRSISWPSPTHGPDAPQPFRTAAECIDWSIPCPSIFGRQKELVPSTLRRIARGVQKFVLEAAQPFIVTMRGTESSHVGSSASSIDAPLRTISAQGTHHALVVPYLVHRSNGERPGQAPRIYDAQRPLGTIVAQGQKHALCVAFLARHYSDRATGGWAGGAPLDKPLPTVTTRDHHSLVAAFLVRYNGTGDAEPVDRPLGTITTRDRFGLAAVTVTLDGEEYVIADIGMRMLTARELYRAQGFPDDYDISPPGPNGKPLSKTAQVKLCGNSVPPPMARAIAAHALASEAA
jgi:DNA (cytosine-5)-methyltransferase 1